MSEWATFKQHLAFRIIRPMVRASPNFLWTAFAHLAAGLFSPWVAWRQRPVLGQVLRLCRRPTSVWARLCLAREGLYHRLRRLDFYLHDGVGDVRTDWSGHPPADQPCCLVLLDTYGAEQIDAFLQAHPSWLVRRRFDGETDSADSAQAALRPWASHCAQLRAKVNPLLTVDINTSPMRLREVIAGQRHIVVFQGFVEPPRAGANERQVLGFRVCMTLGAVRMARRAGLPLRFVQVVPQGTKWLVVIEPPMPAEEQPLLARMERALREQPGRWTLWGDFLAAAQGQLPGARGGRAGAVAMRGIAGKLRSNLVRYRRP